MLETNSGNCFPQLSITGTLVSTNVPDPIAPQSSAPCSNSEEFLTLFELATGWVVEFQESRESYLKRKHDGQDTVTPEGEFAIVDMSAEWPAQKATAHRGHCDDLIAQFGAIMNELLETKKELTRTRSALAALTPEAVSSDDEYLVDSFIPRFETSDDFEVVDPEMIEECFGHDEFQVCQSLNSQSLVTLPFDGWQLGGQTGIISQSYLDWRIDEAEQVSISVGKIESDLGFGDAETTLKFDPLTSEYQVQGSSALSGLFLLDQNDLSCTRLKVEEKWSALKAGQAILAVASEDEVTDSVTDWSEHCHWDLLNAEQVATVIDSHLSEESRLLVLMRSEN